MINTVSVLKQAVYGGLVVLTACAFMADAKTNTALPDMTTTLHEQGVESASVAVIRDGQIVSTGAWGMAGPNRAATVATPYNLASLTKPLTAEVILRLVSAGKLSLNDPMDRYWSDPDLSGDPRRMNLTVRMALSHRTGLPNWRDAKGLAFDHDPGTTTGYSGEGINMRQATPSTAPGSRSRRLLTAGCSPPPICAYQAMCRRKVRPCRSPCPMTKQANRCRSSG
ncbi:hypothetical protein GCM10020258_36170 [Sphingomonas yabuuchiae]